MNEQRGARHAVYLALISGLARAPGFLVPLVIATVFGAGPHTDAYFLVYSTVLLIGGTLGQGLEVAVVPFAARVHHTSPAALRAYLGRAAISATFAATALWVVAVPALILSARAALRPDIARYGAAFAPMVVLWCATSIYSGTLISQWEIAYATASMLWRGAGAIAGLAFAPAGVGLSAVALGLGVGELSRVWWLRRRATLSLPAGTPGGVPSLAPLARAATSQVLASVAGSAAPVAERLLAAGLGVGAISHLEYATRLLVLPTLLFDGALAPMLFARWTGIIAQQGRLPPARDVFRPVLKGMAAAATCAVLFGLFAPQVVRVVLRHGRFSLTDAVAVGTILRILVIGFVFSMGAMLLERVYMAASRNRVLATLAPVRAGARIVLAVLLLPSQGLLAFGFGYTGAEGIYLLALVILTARATSTTAEEH